MDQSFSAKNFRSIYDLDLKNRGDLERKYFEFAYSERMKIRNTKKLGYRFLFKLSKGRIRKEHYENVASKIKEVLEVRKERYDNIVSDEVKIICNKVNKKGYKLPLEKLPGQVLGKDVFTIGKSVESIFVTRHLNNILKNTYDIKQSHRDLIVSRLRSICLDASPKYIVKADVKEFYESIDHKALIKKLHSSTRLSVLPKRILTQLLRSYASFSGDNKGLPRGVGLSAYLSEVYMNELDGELSENLDLTFYSRYVDDLILVYSPNLVKDKDQYLNSVNRRVNRNKLSLNEKTKVIDLTSDKSIEFEYLGYRFIFKGKNVVIRLSGKRVDKYKKRIDQAFHQYFKNFRFNPKKTSRLLIDKVRFLTGNTRLLNAKSKAFTGVYFNNMHINDDIDLKEIDVYFKSKLLTVTDLRLLRRLNNFSFVEGFDKKIFRSFTTADLKDITKGWKDA
jgi:hypothetical protein